MSCVAVAWLKVQRAYPSAGRLFEVALGSPLAGAGWRQSAPLGDDPYIDRLHNSALRRQPDASSGIGTKRAGRQGSSGSRQYLIQGNSPDVGQSRRIRAKPVSIELGLKGDERTAMPAYSGPRMTAFGRRCLSHIPASGTPEERFAEIPIAVDAAARETGRETCTNPLCATANR
jgi:hypothetical protein